MSLVTLGTSYHKLSLLPLKVRPWQKFEKERSVLNFETCYCYFKISYIFIASTKDLNVMQILPFYTSLGMYGLGI